MIIHEIIWGSVADWVSGVGSLSAVIAALYLSKEAQRVRMHGICGHRILFESGKEKRTHLVSIFITNVGTRNTVISNIGLRFGLFRKKYGIIKIIEGEFSQRIPLPLNDGEQAHWGFELDEKKSWIIDLLKQEFVTSWISVQTMCIEVHTTNGGTFRFRPEGPLRKMILQTYKQYLANPSFNRDA